MSTQRMVEFVVKGNGLFPFDMLRYDSCWPRTEEDSARMEYTTRRPGRLRDTKVVLKGLRKPTEARWESFGWKVESVTYASSGRWAA